MDLVPIPSQTVGPYFRIGLSGPRPVGNLVQAETKGERITLVCRVLDGDGVPVPDSMIEIWQANAEGRYNHPQDKDKQENRKIDPTFLGFGRLETDDRGVCAFTTIKPGQVPGNSGAMQASHINVSVFARGILKRLATRIYFAEDPATLQDPVLALVPADRRQTLLAQPDQSRPGEWHFDIHLCGEHETVFFDV